MIENPKVGQRVWRLNVTAFAPQEVVVRSVSDKYIILDNKHLESVLKHSVFESLHDLLKELYDRAQPLDSSKNFTGTSGFIGFQSNSPEKKLSERETMYCQLREYGCSEEMMKIVKKFSDDELRSITKNMPSPKKTTLEQVDDSNKKKLKDSFLYKVLSPLLK